MSLFGRSVEDDGALGRRQLAERHVGTHAHRPAHVGHERPHQAVPRSHGPFVDRLRFVGHERRTVYGHDRTRTAAPATCSAAVERELLGPGRIEPMAAVRADELLLGRDGQRRRMVMPAVRTAVRSQAREHKPQAVEQLGAGAEGAADTRHAWPLVECDGGGNICYFIDLRLGSLRHAPARIGGQRLQIAPRPFGVEHPERQRRFARSRHASDADDAVERNIYIHVFEVVDARTADSYFVRCFLHLHKVSYQTYKSTERQITCIVTNRAKRNAFRDLSRPLPESQRRTTDRPAKITDETGDVFETKPVGDLRYGRIRITQQALGIDCILISYSSGTKIQFFVSCSNCCLHYINRIFIFHIRPMS